VGERERGDDLGQREPAPAAEEETEQEQQVVPAGQDVPDPEQDEARQAAVATRRVVQPHPCLPRLGREGELRRPPRRVDARQRVVVRAEHVEEIVAQRQVADVAAAREVDDERDALRARRRRRP